MKIPERWTPIKRLDRRASIGERILIWDGYSVETVEVVEGFSGGSLDYVQHSDSGRSTSFTPTHYRAIPRPPRKRP